MNKTLLLNKTLLSIALCAAVSMAWAQDKTFDAGYKINPAGRMMIYQYKTEGIVIKDTPGHTVLNSDEKAEPVVSAVVLLAEGYDSSVLSSLDLEVVSELGTVVVVRCPLLMVEKIAEIPQVVQIGFGDKKEPMLDYARPSGSVTDVQGGFTYDGKTMSFDGSGVVCGMMDIGLEANHINFKGSDGKSRIKRLWHMTSTNGTSDEYTDETIGNFTTDNTTQGHATHVGGIIGGSYKGNGKFYKVSAANGTTASLQSSAPIPYYGVATGSDLAFAVGQLSTPNIIAGVTNIINYAESTGQPVVVNLSLGSVIGPHDGTDYYSKALSALGERGIICMSAGNDGNDQLSLTKTLGASGNDAYLRTIPVSQYSDGSFSYGRVSGIVDLWTNGSKPVKVALKAFSGDVSTAVEVLSVTGNNTVSSSTSSNFANYFTGSVTLESYLDTGNNRYDIYMSFNNVGLAASNTTGYLMIEVSGDSGTKLYMYGNGVFFENRMKADAATPIALTKGSAAESINDACCAANIVSVGAYTTRTTWSLLTGSVYQYTGTGFSVGAISPFSSYGTSYEGTKLPLVAAPGANIISSYSSYYAGSNAATTMCAETTSGLKKYYWGAMQGTSMSCPYVTGTIGLWLQADPSLDYKKVMEVINNTSTTDPFTNQAKNRFGAGKINALKGVQYVLANKAAIGEVWADENQRLVLTPTAEGYDVFVADADDVNVAVYDLQGRQIGLTTGTDGVAQVDASALQGGVYILRISGKDFSFSRKVTR